MTQTHAGAHAKNEMCAKRESSRAGVRAIQKSDPVHHNPVHHNLGPAIQVRRDGVATPALLRAHACLLLVLFDDLDDRIKLIRNAKANDERARRERRERRERSR